MTLQWMFATGFLYIEITVLLLFSLPFISPKRWNKIFNSRIVSTLFEYGNAYFNVIVIVMALLLADSIQERRKYGQIGAQPHDLQNNPQTEMMAHMKLFRAQCNLYISGFSLFLLVVLRRVVRLLSHSSVLEASNKARKPGEGVTDEDKWNEELKKRKALEEGRTKDAVARPPGAIPKKRPTQFCDNMGWNQSAAGIQDTSVTGYPTEQDDDAHDIYTLYEALCLENNSHQLELKAKSSLCNELELRVSNLEQDKEEYAAQRKENRKLHDENVRLKEQLKVSERMRQECEEKLAAAAEAQRNDPTSQLHSVKSFEELPLSEQLRRGVYMGFNIPSKILETVLPMLLADPLLHKDCQMLLFSATLDDEVIKFAKTVVPHPIIVPLCWVEESLDNIKQYYVMCCDDKAKFQALSNMYGVVSIGQCIVFCHTLESAIWLAEKMTEDEYSVELLSDEITGEQRLAVLNRFREGKKKILITNTVCARGIDVGQVTVVVNYDVPVKPTGKPDFKTYLHRICCTGRFGKSRIAVNFIDGPLSMAVKDKIEEHFGKKITLLQTDDVEELEKLA